MDLRLMTSFQTNWTLWRALHWKILWKSDILRLFLFVWLFIRQSSKCEKDLLQNSSVNDPGCRDEDEGELLVKLGSKHDSHQLNYRLQIRRSLQKLGDSLCRRDWILWWLWPWRGRLGGCAGGRQGHPREGELAETAGRESSTAWTHSQYMFTHTHAYIWIPNTKFVYTDTYIWIPEPLLALLGTHMIPSHPPRQYKWSIRRHDENTETRCLVFMLCLVMGWMWVMWDTLSCNSKQL